MTTPITGFPSDTAVNTGNTLAGWLKEFFTLPQGKPDITITEDSNNPNRKIFTFPSPSQVSPEEQGNIANFISQGMSPYGRQSNALQATRQSSFDPSSFDPSAPVIQVEDIPTEDLASLVSRPGPIFDPTRVQQNGSSVNQGAFSELNLPELLQSEPVQNEQQPQVKQEDPFQTQLNSYLNSLVANSKLQGQVTQEQLDQLRGEQARLAEVRSPEHRTMSPLDWVALVGRDVDNLIHRKPTVTREGFLQEKYSPEEAYAKGTTEEERARSAAMSEVAAQQLRSLINGGRGLGDIQSLQQGAELYPLVKRLQEAHVASAEQAPKLAQDNAAAMEDYRAAQVDKLQGDLAVALQKAAIMQYNREHPDNPIPLSGNNKAPLFDLGGAINALSGIANGGSVPQGQAPVSDTTEEDDANALRNAFGQ